MGRPPATLFNHLNKAEMSYTEIPDENTLQEVIPRMDNKALGLLNVILVLI